MPDHLNSDELRFAIWPTEHAIFEAHSNEAIHYLVPIVGPTAVVILHHVAYYLSQRPMPYFTTMVKLSHACGGGPQGRRHGVVGRGLDRLVRFGFARLDGPGDYLVRVQVPPLTPRHIAHLPLELQRTVPVR